MPLQIGSPDLAFPRLNMFSYWRITAPDFQLNDSYFVVAHFPAHGLVESRCSMRRERTVNTRPQAE
jgi:heme/copper-type cytochrome/quinol oxidase subunit 1